MYLSPPKMFQLKILYAFIVSLCDVNYYHNYFDFLIFESLQTIKFLSAKFTPVLSYPLFWFRQQLHPIFFSLI